MSSGAAGQTPSGHDAEYLSTHCADLASGHAGTHSRSMHDASASFLPSLSVHLHVQSELCALHSWACPTHMDIQQMTPGPPTHQGRRPMRVIYSTFSQWMLLHSSSSCYTVDLAWWAPPSAWRLLRMLRDSTGCSRLLLRQELGTHTTSAARCRSIHMVSMRHAITRDSRCRRCQCCWGSRPTTSTPATAACQKSSVTRYCARSSMVCRHMCNKHCQAADYSKRGHIPPAVHHTSTAKKPPL